MIHFMHHIKNISPSLSILKPEITAIFSIFNRILGILLLLILIFLPTIVDLILLSNIFIISVMLKLFILFILIFHLIFGRLKLILYFNNIYTFINSNITKIKNIHILFFILV